MIDINALIAEAEKLTGDQPFRYRFSSAGAPCVRALVYDALDEDDKVPSVDGRRHLSHILSAVCGTAVGAHMEKAGKRLGAETQKRCVFDTGAVVVSGSLDMTDADCVDDFKVVGEKKWKRIQNKPDDGHRLQVNGYAVAEDKPFWRLIYIRGISIFNGSERPEVLVHSGRADVILAQELCGVWETVDQHRKLRTLPERVFGAAPDKFPCGWCDHLPRCNPSPEEDAQ